MFEIQVCGCSGNFGVCSTFTVKYMHYENKISVQIPDEDQKRIMASLQVVQELLKPYLIALSQEQRCGFYTNRNKTIALFAP
jgi:hypothetical protein